MALIGGMILSAIGNDRLRFNVIVYLTLQNAVELGHMGKGRTNASRFTTVLLLTYPYRPIFALRNVLKTTLPVSVTRVTGPESEDKT